jgi:hypothetical protein
VGLLVQPPEPAKNGVVPRLRLWWRGISIPQRLLIASALAYGGVFALLLAYGRPGLGIGEGFFVPVILAAAATSAPEGALAGMGALFLYELATHRHGLTFGDFDNAPALTRFVSYVAAGAVVGYLAQRARGMLAQSLYVLEDLIEIADGRREEVERVVGR